MSAPSLPFAPPPTLPPIRPISTRSAVKALNPDSTRIGGYLITWGDPAHRDLHREYFSKSTDLALDWFSKRPVLYHHGLDETCGTDPVGVIDTLKADDQGVWCEAQLAKHHHYLNALRLLIEGGALGWSSGSLPHLVRKAVDGRIERWPLVEASLTPTPAQPYSTSVAALKSAFTTLGLDTAPLARIDPLTFPLPPKLETPTMTEQILQQISQLTDTVSALAETVKTLSSAPVKRLPTPFTPHEPPTPRIEVTRATKYSDLTAADMSFMHELLSGSAHGWRPDPAFYRELADKTLRGQQRIAARRRRQRAAGDQGQRTGHHRSDRVRCGMGGGFVAL